MRKCCHVTILNWRHRNFCSCLRERKPFALIKALLNHIALLFFWNCSCLMLMSWVQNANVWMLARRNTSKTPRKNVETTWKPICNSFLNRMTKDKINSRGLPYQSHAMTAFRITWISRHGFRRDPKQRIFGQGLSFYFSSTDNSEINTKFNGISHNRRWCRFI